MAAEQDQQQYIDQEGAKRQADESHQPGESPSMKKQRGEEDYGPGEGPDITLRFLIQSQAAGGIIGKGGVNIKRLRTDYNAGLTVPDCYGPERVLTVSGKFGDVMGCLGELMTFLKEGGGRRRGQYQEEQTGNSEARLLVHQSSAGAIIGRAGFKIKELREASKCDIKVYTECCPNSSERVVQFNGSGPTIVDGIRNVLKVVQDAPIKGPIQVYDPFCYSAGDYGGHGVLDAPPPFSNFPPLPGGGGRMGGPDRSGRGMPFMMRGGRGGGRMGPYGGAGSGRGGGRRMNEGFDLPGGRGAERGGGNENFTFGEQKNFEAAAGEQEGVNSTQVTIPKDLAGSIIGNRGERINEIRHRSGAKIKIAEAVLGSNDRVITITGDDEAITNAQYLLQHSVRRYSGKGGY